MRTHKGFVKSEEILWGDCTRASPDLQTSTSPCPKPHAGNGSNGNKPRQYLHRNPVHPPNSRETAATWTRNHADDHGQGTEVATSSVAWSAARCARSASARMVRTIANTASMAVSKTKGQSRRLIATAPVDGRRALTFIRILSAGRLTSPRRTGNPVPSGAARQPTASAGGR